MWIGVGLLVTLVYVAFMFDVPRFAIGMLQFGRQARKGDLQVGDPMPEVDVHELPSGEARSLKSLITNRPLVLVFGSFT